MGSTSDRLSSSTGNLDSPLSTIVLVCVVAILSYLAPRLEAALLLHPQTVWPLWPGCAILVSALLLVRRRIWPILIAAAFAGFVLYDLQAGVPVASIAWFIPADTVQVLIAAIGLRYCFDSMPRLNSVKSLANYWFFAAFLAPFAGAFVSALGIPGDYWKSWRISFLSEVLAFITLTPAILSWVTEGPAWLRRSRAYHLETAAMVASTALLGYIIFTAPGRDTSPALLYSLVPFLLWSALRFGLIGITSSMSVIVFLSIWGAVHGRGPFSEQGPHRSMLSLQLFLVFAALPFMVLAALAEERKRAEKTLRRREGSYRMFVTQSSEAIFCMEMDAPMSPDLPEDEQIHHILYDSYMGECNDAMARMYGVPSSYEFVGKRLTDMLVPNDPHNIELTREYIRSGFKVLERESHEQDVHGCPKVFLNSMIGIVENGKLVRTWGIQRDITGRKRAEEVLRESEERLRLATQAGRMYAYEWDIATDVVVRSPECADILGVGEPTRTTRQQLSTSIHPDDRAKFTAAVADVTPENPRIRINYRLLLRDGSVIWLEKIARACFDGDGRMLRMIGMVADFTERKLAEEALSNVSRRLIEAQEQERTRIARDLHDDINQQLALLAIEMEQLRQNLPDSAAKVADRMGELSKRTGEIAADVQSMSHELHSSKLEYLGLVAAIRSFCKEFGEQQKVQIDFSAEHFPSTMPQAISLSLFRVVQEALKNAAKHSEVRHFDVKLRGTSDEVHLTVSDPGVGFDPEEAMNKRGLGLISMRERIKLVNGTVSIVSKPMGGTTIHARVPLSSRSDSMRAAG